MYQNAHIQLNKNWINPESKKIRYEGFCHLKSAEKFQTSLLEVASVHFNENR